MKHHSHLTTIFQTSKKLLQGGDHGIGHARGRTFASDIRRSGLPFLQNLAQGVHEKVGGGLFLELFQHHGDGPEGSGGIGDPFARDVGCGAVDGFEHAG